MRLFNVRTQADGDQCRVLAADGESVRRLFPANAAVSEHPAVPVDWRPSQATSHMAAVKGMGLTAPTADQEGVIASILGNVGRPADNHARAAAEAQGGVGENAALQARLDNIHARLKGFVKAEPGDDALDLARKAVDKMGILSSELDSCGAKLDAVLDLASPGGCRGGDVALAASKLADRETALEAETNQQANDLAAVVEALSPLVTAADRRDAPHIARQARDRIQALKTLNDSQAGMIDGLQDVQKRLERKLRTRKAERKSAQDRAKFWRRRWRNAVRHGGIALDALDELMKAKARAQDGEG